GLVGALRNEVQPASKPRAIPNWQTRLRISSSLVSRTRKLRKPESVPRSRATAFRRLRVRLTIIGYPSGLPLLALRAILASVAAASSRHQRFQPQLPRLAQSMYHRRNRSLSINVIVG